MSTLRRASLAAGLLAAAALALSPTAGAAPPEPDVPGRIAVPAGNKLFLVGHAVGVQIHRCDGNAWVFVAPRADLYGDNGQLISTHYAGPAWEAKDGSKVVGTRVDGVPVTGAIPWLLLSGSASAGPDGDRLAGTTYIQRLATTGGLTPPAADCGPATAGAVREVPYTADYYFWKKSD
jgi:Protein of unknown function (DUF3455)